ncbi:hypothetical protein CAPTEDRAFT_174103 [Capitella teleta]|uniref:Translin-associated factor X-interacting protein 1 N-terminal domain-containing protein n=1 Tax=Capitella teleta TaxID=283909 RepID=R7TYE8_CAPTE|nr:hypothetical protein CAPTEDRAFT_174103 [Capitella teleta]|eukprot:ELT95990.1 hypothetical protein CAPTEDRAFT_174103 [Capitella teleta]
MVTSDEAPGKPSMVPKPQFLHQLEGFLQKELKALGVSDVEPGEVRLQAYREVFEYLIEDFKTYKPLLAAIKNEYEMMLAAQREHIRNLEPLKQMLVTVSEQCDQKIMAIRDQEKQEMKDLKEQNRGLFGRIDELCQEKLDLEAQVEKLQEELAAEYLRYRDECDARKLLVADINDLRYQQEDVLRSKKNSKENEEEKDDPVMLRIALKQAREDESRVSKRLSEMIANYGDVIPRRDFESLQKEYKVLEIQLEQMKGDYTNLKMEHGALLDTHKQVVAQRDEYFTECKTLRRSATPRPDWNRCADYVTGGIVRWKEISENKTSDQLVESLLLEIQGATGSDSNAEAFDGLGLGDEVPKYLRHEGQVRNRRLGKRDTALLIKDIWREKSTKDAERTDGKRENLADYLAEYLQQKFPLQQMSVEWAYNLQDACQRYAHDENIGLFWNVLSEKGDEELYHGQLQLIAKLLNHLVKMDEDNGNLGELTKDNFRAALGEFLEGYMLKVIDEDTMNSLVKAAEMELEAKESPNLQFKNLFMEDDEGRTGPFLDELKREVKQHRLRYIDEIKIEIGNGATVSVDDLKIAITTTDPEIDHTDMETYLCWAFKAQSKDELASAQPMDNAALIERLKNGNLRRIGKKN